MHNHAKLAIFYTHNFQPLYVIIPGPLIMPMDMPIMPSWANDHAVGHLQTKMDPMNLISSLSAQWLLSFSFRKIPGALIMPKGMPIMPPWANDHDVAHLQVKTVTMNLIWIKSSQWLLSFSICKIPGAIIMPMGMPILPSWANDHDIAHIQAKTVPMNLIWSESAQWLRHSSICKIPGALTMPIMLPWRCTSTGQDSSKQVNLEWIGPVVAEFWCPQDSRCLYYRFHEPLLCPWAFPY